MNGGRKLRFALLGCGSVVQKHLAALAANEDAQLVAVADTVRVRAEAAAALTGVPAYSSLEQLLLRHPDIDVVSILTPSGDHARDALTCLSAGRHVLVEKPLALSVEDGNAVNHRAAEVGRRVFVVNQVRHNRAVTRLREQYDAGHFGNITLGTVRVRRCREQAYYDGAPWRGTWSMDGGVLTNQASHHIDLLQWFLGEPERVYAVSRRALLNVEADDTTTGIIEFRGGAVGVVEASTAVRPKDLEASFSLLGERGSAVVGGYSVNEITTWNFQGAPLSAEALQQLIATATNDYGYGHIQVYTNVCGALLRDEPASVDGQEAVKCVRLISALYESARTSLPVLLSGFTDHAQSSPRASSTAKLEAAQ